MLSNQDIKKINRYKIKKYRLQDRLFLAEGTKLVSELTTTSIKIKDIIISEDYKEKHSLSSYKTFNLSFATNQQFKKISVQNNPDGILALCEMPITKTKVLENQWVIALDYLQDPGNLGTIIRIADWFGIKKIICSENTVDAYNPKVVQSTMGSIGRVEISYLNLEHFFKNYNGTIYGATLKGESIYNLKTIEPGIIIIGNESNGISDYLLKLVNKEITIPKRGKAESLNAGVAAAIILSHFTNTFN